jgi:hypothetical protein
MRRRAVLAATLVLALATVMSAALAAPMSAVGDKDLGRLLERAGQAFDLEQEDAVLLHDEVERSWTPDGRLVERIHRIMYVRTDWAVDHYADWRVPYDSRRQRIDVRAMRVWRSADDALVESGETARVETLPFALAQAYDYDHLREMMLLHDGIEIPCVIETSYVIEDREPWRDGADGLWTARREEPSLESIFVLGLPRGTRPTYVAANGLSEPERASDEQRGLDLYTFRAGPVPALPDPPTAERAHAAPHVTWSTWPSWSALGADLARRLGEAAQLDDDLRTALEAALAGREGGLVRARAAARLVADGTRLVDYAPADWWAQLRPAHRVHATAYGHPLDRAVLASALLREAGLRVSPILVGAGFADLAGVAPGRGGAVPLLLVQGEHLAATFDPRTGRLEAGSGTWGRTRWTLDDEPEHVEPAGHAERTWRLELTRDEKSESWRGKGVYRTTDALSAYPAMAGVDGEAHAHLGRALGAVLPGSSPTGHSTAVFTPALVEVGLSFDWKPPEPDARGRRPLKLCMGELDDAMSTMHPWELERGSAVHLAQPLRTRQTVVLEPADVELVRLPRDQVVENELGSFRVEVTRKEGRATVTRELRLDATEVPAEQWPLLRELLTAARADAHRLILLR